MTGAGGYIGRHVVSHLLDNGADVIAMDITTEGLDPKATILESNFTGLGPDAFEELGRPDTCLHLAWKDGFKHDSTAHMLNLSGHYQFLENMIAGGLGHLAVMGSMHEVGYFEGEINENTPTNPSSLYGIAKNALRQAITLIAKKYGIIFQWLRGFYIYGDDLKNNSIFTKLTQAELNHQATFPFTTGKNKYDFISIEEFTMQICMCVLQREVTGIINCCSGKAISLRDMVEDYIQANGFKIQLKYGTYPDRPYDSPAIWGNSEKVQRIMDNHKRLR